VDLLISSIGFGLVTASILALGAVGFTMQFGVTNILNLAYGEVMGASGFIALILNNRGVNIWICLGIGGVFGAVFSFALNRFVLVPFVRRGTKLFGMVIVTIAIGLIIENTILAIAGPGFFSYTLPHQSNLHIGSLILTGAQLVIIALAVVCMAIVHFVLRYTKLGIAMRATATDNSLARGCGIRTDRVVDVAWLMSGAMCGLAGVTLFINTSAFTSATANEFLVVIVAAAVLGGIGHAHGAMLGALVLGLATEISAAYISPDYKNVFAFVILVVVLLLRPQGILAEIATQREVAA
jgi:branched-chain amino acid transport system permease protein/neutral amino acid transport system permease protein